MQRASSTVGSIAAALAKAQVELNNPEKSLTAQIRAGGSHGPLRSFRYAPLSSGLDIVRKTLGRHEIATFQTTAVDPATNWVNLTTVLAHSSGEWVASDWPVFSMNDRMALHQTGAALTYARRYSLFTLVGIAGEDDLDAPEADSPSVAVLPEAALQPTQARQAPAPSTLRSQHSTRHDRAPPAQPNGPPPEQSATLRDKTLSEIEALNSPEGGVAWASKALKTKNRMTTPDALVIESAFMSKMTSLRSPETTNPPDVLSINKEPLGESEEGITATMVSPRRKLVRHRDRLHLKFVGSKPCTVCGREPSDAHHLRFAEPRTLGRKVSDEFTVPLCRTHHREVHQTNNETQWWQALGIEPLAVAESLWRTTRLQSSADQAGLQGQPPLTPTEPASN